MLPILQEFILLGKVALGRAGKDLGIERARIPAHHHIADVEDDTPHGAPNRAADGQASALAGFVARVGLVDDVDPALATHELAVAVTRLQRLQGAADFHGDASSIRGGAVGSGGVYGMGSLKVNQRRAAGRVSVQVQGSTGSSSARPERP